MGGDAGWIFWHSLVIVLMRIIIVWLFLNTGQSILIAVLFHVMSNSGWGVFANPDPFYDPLFMCAVLLVAVAVILWLKRPDMWARDRYPATRTHPVTTPSPTTICRRHVAAIFSSWVDIRNVVPSSRLIWPISSIT